MSRDREIGTPLSLRAAGQIACADFRDALTPSGRDSRRSYKESNIPQMIRNVIAFSTARVRSRVPSLSRMVDT